MVGLRFPLILGWAGAVVVATAFLPPLPSAGGGLTGLIPAGSAAAHADADATRLFGYPLEAGVAIVQRNSRGLPPAVVEATAYAAAGYDRSPGIPGLIIVRSFLVPALVALSGRVGMWPGHQRVREDGRRTASMSGARR